MRGGGARCISYIGILKALEKLQIHPEIILCSSGGAIIGSLYAAGYTVDQMTQIAHSVKVKDFVGTSSFKYLSLLSVEKVKAKLNDLFGNKKHEDCKINLYIQCTNLETCICENLSSGEIKENLMCSIAHPLLLPNITLANTKYMDGDFTATFGAKFLREQDCNFVVGLYPGSYTSVLNLESNNPLNRVRKGIAIMQDNMLREDLKNNPVDLLFDNLAEGIPFLDFSQTDKMIDDAYRIGLTELPKYF